MRLERNRLTSWSLGLGAACLVVAGLRAQIVYDNSTTVIPGAIYGVTNEFGDEISLAGIFRFTTKFEFEYFGGFTPHGDEEVRLRFYALDGPKFLGKYSSPGTVLFDSGFAQINTNYSTFSVVFVPPVQVPNTLVWAVQFRGLSQTSGDEAGLLIYDPPTVGAELPTANPPEIAIGSYVDFWQNYGTEATPDWKLVEFTDLPGNFGARLIAIPEPGPVALAGCAALVWLGGGLARRGCGLGRRG